MHGHASKQQAGLRLDKCSEVWRATVLEGISRIQPLRTRHQSFSAVVTTKDVPGGEAGQLQ